MENWRSEVVRLRLDENTPWPDILEKFKDKYPGRTREQMRKALFGIVKRAKARAANAEKETVEPPSTKPFAESNGYNKDKDIHESDKLIEICESEEITPELILKLHNLDPEKWEVVSYKNNYWHSQKKGGKRLVMYQSKLLSRPIVHKLTFEDVNKYFEGKKYATPPRIPIDLYDPDGEVLEIDIADPHNGLLAWIRETGADYDIHIAKARFMKVIFDNLNRCQERKFKRIYLALLGDLLHIDNDLQTTTKGTFQQADGRIAKIFETTLDALIEAVALLGGIAPVEVIYTSGNHDGTSGWMLIKALQNAFRFDTNIVVDTEPNPQKHRLIGVTLVGFVHGDMPDQNRAGWLQVIARKMPVQIMLIEVHTGHDHGQKVKERLQTEEKEGAIVRTMPSIASSSTWAHRQGYIPICVSASFVWNEKTGLREMWYTNI